MPETELKTEGFLKDGEALCSDDGGDNRGKINE